MILPQILEKQDQLKNHHPRDEVSKSAEIVPIGSLAVQKQYILVAITIRLVRDQVLP